MTQMRCRKRGVNARYFSKLDKVRESLSTDPNVIWLYSCGMTTAPTNNFEKGIFRRKLAKRAKQIVAGR